MQRVVTRDLELLERIVGEDGVGKGRSLERDGVGHRAQRPAQFEQGIVGLAPAAGLALEEGELAARRELARAEPEDERIRRLRPSCRGP